MDHGQRRAADGAGQKPEVDLRRRGLAASTVRSDAWPTIPAVIVVFGGESGNGGTERERLTGSDRAGRADGSSGSGNASGGGLAGVGDADGDGVVDDGAAGAGECCFRVTDVVDGDTVEVQSLGPVRLIGIDTPERGTCEADEATEFTEGRIGGASISYVVGVEERDRYDRLLAYVYDPQGRMHNLELAENGYAEVLTIPPNDEYAGEFKQAVQDARVRYDDVPRGACEPETPEPPPVEPSPSQQPSPDPPSAPSGGGGVPQNCDGVAGPIPTPPGDPTGLDGDGDGTACE